MSEPCVSIRLEKDAYRPAELLAGAFQITGDPLERYTIELSVLWHTDGKGDEDMSVHFFERVEAVNGELVDYRQPRRFSTILPNSPLSYPGLIVKICWCVRVRVFLTRARELALDVPFQLGGVPHPQQV